jgi:VCBS repeat-containing protein
VNTVTITVTGTNDLPTLAAITAAATEDGTDITVDLAALGGDVDSDDTGATLTYTVSGAPGEGTASIDGMTLTFATGTAFQDLKLNETRDVIVQVTATDAHNATAVNTVTITVTGTNDLPTATVDTNATDPLVEQGFGVAGDSTATGNLLSNDSDPDTTDVLSVTNVDSGTGEAGSNMPVEATTEQIVLGKFGSLAVAATGVWTYSLNNADADTEALEDGETGVETFTYMISDGIGGTDTATLTLEIAGSGDNVAPVALDDKNTNDAVVEDGVGLYYNTVVRAILNAPRGDNTATGNVLDNDTAVDANDNLHVVSVNGVSNNFGMGVQGIYGSVFIGSDGVYTYTLNDTDPDTRALAHDEAATDVFTYEVSDGNGGSDTATLSIDITGTNDIIYLPPGGGFRLAFAGEEITKSTAVDLTDADLDAMLDVALDRWANAGMSQEGLDMMAGAEIAISDLGGTTLGATLDGSIVIDINAAGQGWYIDETPADDFEFVDSSGPEGVDLLTVLMHELGHIVGLEHSENDAGHSVMAAELDLGQRLMVSEFDGRDASIEYVGLSTDIFDYF